MANNQKAKNEFERLTPKVEQEESNKHGEDSMTLSQFSKAIRSYTRRPQAPKVIVDHAKSHTSCKRKRSLMDPDKAKLCAIKRAEEFQSNLVPEFPSFVKSMLHSHVASGFWLGFPVQFCRLNLPKQDITITLVDENGEKYPTKYLFEKSGLSAGWRGFSIAHKLVQGDALVFQLVKVNKFKVYIARAYGLAEVDGALGLLNLDARVKQTDPVEQDAGKGAKNKTTKKPLWKHSRTLPLAVLKGNNQTTSHPTLGFNHGSPAEQLKNDSEEANSEVLEGIRFSGSIVKFKDVKNLNSFTIVVNGLVIDSEISEYVRTKYFELCCSQKDFLHDHLLEGLNCKLVAGIISETVNIADAIKASTLNTSQNEFAIWEKSLRAFEHMGMNVGFLQSQLQQLVSLAMESKQAMDSTRYREAILGRARLELEINTVKVKLVELKETSKRFDAEIETLIGLRQRTIS